MRGIVPRKQMAGFEEDLSSAFDKCSGGAGRADWLWVPNKVMVLLRRRQDCLGSGVQETSVFFWVYSVPFILMSCLASWHLNLVTPCVKMADAGVRSRFIHSSRNVAWAGFKIYEYEQFGTAAVGVDSPVKLFIKEIREASTSRRRKANHQPLPNNYLVIWHSWDLFPCVPPSFSDEVCVVVHLPFLLAASQASY